MKHHGLDTAEKGRVRARPPNLENFIFHLTLYGHIKTARRRTIIQQYGDWYMGHLWVGCYIWYREEGPGLPSPLLAVPNVTAHPSAVSVPTSAMVL